MEAVASQTTVCNAIFFTHHCPVFNRDAIIEAAVRQARAMRWQDESSATDHSITGGLSESCQCIRSLSQTCQNADGVGAVRCHRTVQCLFVVNTYVINKSAKEISSSSQSSLRRAFTTRALVDAQGELKIFSARHRPSPGNNPRQRMRLGTAVSEPAAVEWSPALHRPRWLRRATITVGRRPELQQHIIWTRWDSWIRWNSGEVVHPNTVAELGTQRLELRALHSYR